MPTISQEIRAEVAKRPKALVLKTSCATHSRSSNLLLGAHVFYEYRLSGGLELEVELIRTALIPEEKVSDREMAEILDIDKKMRRGERTRLDHVLAELKV